MIETENVRGEIVIVVEGNKEDIVYDIDPLSHINQLIKENISEKEAIKMVAKMHHINKNDLYKEYQARK